MSERMGACCGEGCGYAGPYKQAVEHVTGCVRYAERCRDEPEYEGFDPAVEWQLRQREDGDLEPAGDSREQVARHRAEQIRKAGAWIVDAYAAAVLDEDWKALGYDDVAQWREAEFGVFRLLPQVRAEAAQLMLEGGQAVPDIAAATGVTEHTIRGDLAAGDAPQSGDNTSGHAVHASSQPVAVSDGSQVSEITVTPQDVTPPARKRAQRARQQEPRCVCTACGHEHARKEEN